MVWLSYDQHIFRHPWEQVVEAALRKYPNPETPNVSSTDIVDRKIDESGRLLSTKMITSVWSGPFMDLMSRISGFNLSKKSHAVEFSTIDPKNRTFQLRSRNFTLMDYICVDETLSYTADPNDPESTILKQEWKITCQNLTFNSFLENSMGTTMKSNASKGRAGVEWVINYIKEEVENLNVPSLETIATKSLEEINETLEGVQTIATKSIEEIGDTIEEVSTMASKTLEELSDTIETLPQNIEKIGKKWEENLHEELQEFIKSGPSLINDNSAAK